MNGKGIAPGTLIAAIAVFIMAFGGGWTLMQSQFTSVAKTQEEAQAQAAQRDEILLDRIKVLEDGERKQARDPVEKATLDAIVSAIDKRDELIQASISDINRQIAAALIIIDNNIDNNGGAIKKAAPALPP